MPRPCSVCTHEEADKINALLLEGNTYSGISRLYGLSEDAVKRHVDNGHISDKLVKARHIEEISSADELLKQFNTLLKLSWDITGSAVQSGDNNAALKGIREVRENLKVLLDTAARLQEAQQHGASIEHAPEFIQLKTRLMSADICPECRIALSEALR